MILFDPAHPGELIRETLDGFMRKQAKDLQLNKFGIITNCSSTIFQLPTDLAQSLKHRDTVHGGLGLRL